VISFRLRGHLLAELDPLGRPRPPLEHVADVGLVSRAHFNEVELETLVAPIDSFDETPLPLRRVLERMRNTYCRHIGVEFAHMYDSERRRWLLRKMEQCENAPPFTVLEQRRLLQRLCEAEAFETTIHAKFQAAKRFSAEGGEVTVAMLDAFVELGGALGIREVVFGMAHRGRLNVLCNILKKPADEIFSEFAGPTDPTQYLNRGDVKYHMGYSNDRTTQSGQTIHVSMAFNPSHLGVVHPVVEGRVRAKQDHGAAGGAAAHGIVPFIIHGDAAFSGQGLVAETLNLAGLEAYSTGGTIHLIVNNQIGYTTEPAQGRSALYCTGMAQMLDIPIFHVNGDDPEACVHVMRLATEYRQRFQSDVVIDLVCYRKYGHNEGDEPAFTQPKMYELIRAHSSVRRVYASQLEREGRLTESETKAIFDECAAEFLGAHARAKENNRVADPSHLQGVWSKFGGGADAKTPQVETGLSIPTLKALLGPLAVTPPGFTLHPNIQRGVIEARQRMLRDEEPVDWGTAETLAYASVAQSGFRVRVSGQDSERGTFAHRQAVLHDLKTGASAFPLGAVAPNQGPVLVVNSPLSEMACLGFEFGYSLDCPDGLVVWEAQFGDFVNNGQVIIDQFIAAAEDKWKRLSGLTLLLPHGYEGAGPEHSTARLERFLELAAEDNLQICVPTTAAQIFHLLRRQVMRTIRKPLIVMTPKSLLRLAEAKSPWSEFSAGTYRRVIDSGNASGNPAEVRRLLLCSGKVYFDLLKRRSQSTPGDVALVRLEQLYPLPEPELVAVLSRYSAVEEVFWVQEEPKNGGAWKFVLEPLTALLAAHAAAPLKPPLLRYVGRPESASPATGFLQTHRYEQDLIIDEAFSKGSHVS
jgi:2-oxoglutarate dehydrogenase E1 component